MPESFAQYLGKWLKQTTAQGLNNPLVKMPVRRFRPLEQAEITSLADRGSLIIGTMSDPIARNLYKNFQTRIRKRGEHCAFLTCCAIEMPIAGAAEIVEDLQDALEQFTGIAAVLEGREESKAKA